MDIKILLTSVFCSFWATSLAQEFEDNFANCHVGEDGFDACVRDGLNAVRPYFKTGLPKYNVAPFDPFYFEPITASRGSPFLGFTINLTNVTEAGWTICKFTRFVSDLSNYRVQYTQSFPDKALAGNYEITANVFGNRITNKGKFTLTLYDLVQTSTITRKPGTKLQANIDVQKINNLALHITNLVQGRQLIESMLDRIINTMWQPGFVVLRGLINEMVSSTFTVTFGKAFQNFPFERIFKSSSNSI